MKTLGKILFLLAAVTSAASASAEKVQVRKPIVVKRTAFANRKAYDTVFDQRRRYMETQEKNAWDTYQRVKDADEKRVNAHYVTTGKWANPSPAVEQTRDHWHTLYNTPKP